MDLDNFDKKTMAFLYFLTLNKKLMNSKEVSDKFVFENKKFTDRSVRRWFRSLQNNGFDYYPSLICSSIGLTAVCVLLSNLKEEKILDIIPYKTYVSRGISSKTMKNSFLAFYWIPTEHVGSFKNFWKKVMKLKLVDRAKILRIRSVFYLYTPFHEVITGGGTLNLSTSIDGISSHTCRSSKLFEATFHKRQHMGGLLHRDIYRNPFIVPTMLEFYNGHGNSSKKIWLRIKQKLADRAWLYIKNIKKRKRKTDGVAVRYVQGTIKYLHQHFEEFFQQMVVLYRPFFSKGAFVCFVLKLKSQKAMLGLSTQISKNSLMAIVCPSDRNCVLCYTLTNNRGFLKIVEEVLPRYIDKGFDNQIIWHSRMPKMPNSGSLFLNYQNLFDPISVRWKYSPNNYLCGLNKLNKLGRRRC